MPEEIFLEHGGARYLCRLIPNQRNRHLRLSLDETAIPGARTTVAANEPCGLLPGFEAVSPAALRVTFPPRLSRVRVLEAVRSHLPWVERQLARRPPVPGVGRQPMVSGARLPLLGSPLILAVLPTERIRPRVSREDGRLVVRARDTRPAAVKRALERWFRAEAERVLARRLAELAPGVTARPFQMTVRAQKRRWGSCSEGRRLSLNWKLIFMPEFALNYVLIHELAHLEEMNHSERFWERVAAHCPYWKTARAWLRRHGPELEW